jgi:hypothetical protein
MALDRLKRNLRLHPPFRLGPSVRLEEGGAALASQSPRIGAVAGWVAVAPEDETDPAIEEVQRQSA